MASAWLASTQAVAFAYENRWCVMLAIGWNGANAKLRCGKH